MLRSKHLLCSSTYSSSHFAYCFPLGKSLSTIRTLVKLIIIHSLVMASSRALISKSKRLYRGKRVGQEFNLSSFLWENLPESVVEEILARLPFSSLMRMCSVQKRWRDLILSSRSSSMFPRCTSPRGRLLLFNDGKLEAYKSVASRGTQGRMWEAVSLQFLQEFILHEVIASAAGVLCFHATSGEPGIIKFIVCNPITKCYKSLQLLCHREASAINDKPCMPTSASPHHYNSSYMFTSYLGAGMVVDSNTGHFKLIVIGIHPSSRGTTLVYDSSADSWKKVAPVLNLDVNLLPHGLRGVQCGKSLYFNLKCGGASNRLRKYDVEHETWSWIRLPKQMDIPQDIIEHNGKIVFMTSNNRTRRSIFKMFKMKAFELQDEGPALWMPINHPPFSTISEAVPDMRGIRCFGQGDGVFLIRKVDVVDGAVLPSSMLSALGTSVREFCRDSTNSYVDSGWQKCTGDQRLPLSLVFMPSTLLLK